LGEETEKLITKINHQFFEISVLPKACFIFGTELISMADSSTYPYRKICAILKALISGLEKLRHPQMFKHLCWPTNTTVLGFLFISSCGHQLHSKVLKCVVRLICSNGKVKGGICGILKPHQTRSLEKS